MIEWYIGTTLAFHFLIGLSISTHAGLKRWSVWVAFGLGAWGLACLLV